MSEIEKIDFGNPLPSHCPVCGTEDHCDGKFITFMCKTVVKVIGFTGTQEGMTDPQKKALEAELDRIDGGNWLKEFHHGDCIGADADAHEIAKKWFLGKRRFNMTICVHPPLNKSKRAYCKGDIFYAPKEYLERNQRIVDLCNILIATPKGPEEVRSGTWSTIRRARKKGIVITIIYPDGTIENE